MTRKPSVSSYGATPAVLLVFLLSGCASLTSSKEELQSLGDDEGIVVGSVLLTAAPGDASESGFAFLGGRKAGELEYSVAVSQAAFNPLKPTYSLPAVPGKEEFFVKKLPAGSYRLDNIKPSGILAPTALTFPLGLAFTVRPRAVSYIGRLEVNFPDRIRAGSSFRFAVRDARQETIEKLKNDYPSIVPNAVSALAGRDEGPSLVPGSTVASPLLQRDTLRIILVMDGAEDQTCAKRTVVNTESVRKPTRPEDSGEERWTVDRCGRTVPYRVTFTPSARGGTDIGVKPEK
jgi:hypothetical protein